MIRSRFPSVRNPWARNRNNNRDRRRPDPIPFEKLEDKLCLAFVGFFDGGTSTLTLTQTLDDGNVTVDNNGAGGIFRTTDGVGTVDFVAADNLIVNMIDLTGNNVNLDLDNAHAGDVTLNLGEGIRAVNFTGTSNAIGGDLAINSGIGSQTIELAVNADLGVTGSASFSTGTAFDQVDEDGRNITVGGDWNMTNVNRFENNGTMNVGGNVVFDVSADDAAGDFDNDTVMNIAGDFTFIGGSLLDNVQTNADFNLTGNYFADVADGGSNFNINSATVNIDGTTTLISSGAAGVDDLDTIAGATFGGDVTLDFGDGTNNADFFGTFNGSNVSYTGGTGVDTVNYDFSGNPADVVITLGDGVDNFTLGPNASIDPTTLTVDFGDDGDTYTNNFGNFTFDAMLLGLQGFDYAYDSTTDSLTASETAINAATVEFDDNGTGGAIRFNNATSITTATNLTVNMLDGSGNQLNIDIDTALAGDLNVDLGDGARTMRFISGIGNTFNGNVSVTAGTDAQSVNLADNFAFTVLGDASFDLGTGSDVIDENANNISIGGNLNFTGVNAFENNGTMTVGGNVVVDNSADDVLSEFDNDNNMTITGDFTYTGNDLFDTLNTNANFNVGGNYLVNVGDGGSQFNINGTGVFGGTVTVTSTDSANTDTFNSNNATNTFNGDVSVSFGDGVNNAVFFGVFNGNSVAYTGGVDVDTVNYDFTGNPANVNASLGAGDDSFQLGASASIATDRLRVDFGGGNDTLINNFGQFTFNASLLNLNGFNHFYFVATDLLNMVQLVDTGDVTLDNNGAGNAIRLLNGTTTATTVATNVRLNLLSGSSSNVTVDFDSAQAGFLILDMKQGARDVMFTGSSNSIGGYLRIEAGNGGFTQNVDLAVNADLNVGGNVVINLRDGSDVIDDGANNINVGGNFILRSVNLFENTNNMSVGGNLNMISSLETEATRLDNDGTMSIGGNLTYIGGDAADDVLLNVGGVSIGGNVFIDLADGNDVVNAQNISLTGGFSAARLAIVGGTSLGGNEVVTDAATTVIGDVTLNFTAGTTANNVFLFGNYGGTYGTYRGGSDGDSVTFGATGNDMTFVSRLNNGNDTFSLNASTVLLATIIDFGNDIDTFNDGFGGAYLFPTTILNLP